MKDNKYILTIETPGNKPYRIEVYGFFLFGSKDVTEKECDNPNCQEKGDHYTNTVSLVGSAEDVPQIIMDSILALGSITNDSHADLPGSVMGKFEEDVKS